MLKHDFRNAHIFPVQQDGNPGYSAVMSRTWTIVAMFELLTTLAYKRHSNNKTKNKQEQLLCSASIISKRTPGKVFNKTKLPFPFSRKSCHVVLREKSFEIGTVVRVGNEMSHSCKTRRLLPGNSTFWRVNQETNAQVRRYAPYLDFKQQHEIQIQTFARRFRSRNWRHALTQTSRAHTQQKRFSRFLVNTHQVIAKLFDGNSPRAKVVEVLSELIQFFAGETLFQLHEVLRLVTVLISSTPAQKHLHGGDTHNSCTRRRVKRISILPLLCRTGTVRENMSHHRIILALRSNSKDDSVSPWQNY